MNNRDRLNIIQQAKASGYTGSYLDLFEQFRSEQASHIEADTPKEINQGLEGAPYGTSATLNYEEKEPHILEGRQDYSVKVNADGKYQGILKPGEEYFIVETSSTIDEDPVLKYGGVALKKENNIKKYNSGGITKTLKKTIKQYRKEWNTSKKETEYIINNLIAQGVDLQNDTILRGLTDSPFYNAKLRFLSSNVTKNRHLRNIDGTPSTNPVETEDYLYQGFPKLEEGGIPAEEEIQTLNIEMDEFAKNYSQSDNFKSMLTGQGYDEDEIQKIITDIQAFDPNKNITYSTDNPSAGMAYNPAFSFPSGKETRAPAFTDEGITNLNYNPNVGPPNHPFYNMWDQVVAHEGGHLGFMENKLNRKTRKALKSLIYPGSGDDTYSALRDQGVSRKDAKKAVKHMEDPYEIRANLFQLRHQLQKEGIYDSFKVARDEEGGTENEFTIEHLKKIIEFDEDGNFKGYKPKYQNEMFQNIHPQDIVWMMNNIAQAPQDDLEEGFARAKTGGIVKNMRTGGFSRAIKYQGNADGNVIKGSEEDPNIYPDREFTKTNPMDWYRLWKADTPHIALENARARGFEEWKNILPKNISNIDPSLYDLEAAFKAGLNPVKNEGGTYSMPNRSPSGRIFLSEDDSSFYDYEMDLRSQGHSFYKDPHGNIHSFSESPKGPGKYYSKYLMTEDYYDIYKDATGKKEGYELTGYIPTKGSGVTIARGFDIGQFSTSQINSLFEDHPDLRDKLLPYAGLSTKRKVKKAGLDPEDLVIEDPEAETITRVLFNKFYGEMKPYTQNATEGQVAQLFQLKHWAGSLGNHKRGGKLSPKGENYVWDVINKDSYTTQDLYDAIQNTMNDVPKRKRKEANYNHLKRTLKSLEDLLKQGK